MTEKDMNPATDDKSKAFCQSFQDAYEVYVKALDEAWNKVQQQSQDDQLEFQRQMMKLNQTTCADEFKAIQERMQQMATPSVDLSSMDEAYTQYKNAIKVALTNANIEDMDPTSLWMIGQSFCMIAQSASQPMMLSSAVKTS
jgi:hypothetical protein